MNLTESLLHWYNQNKRPLPWRETRDPYKIWISEVILQQTRVAQGMDYYHRFLIAFPDVQSLAKADEQEVLKLWQGLGYYSRARNMHQAAKEVVEKNEGIFPHSSAGLKNLKGIGDYTAAAIASICFDEAITVLDGNVARVITRLYAINSVIDTNAGRSVIAGVAGKLLETHHPGTFNQALMELGALVCSPKNPSCNSCPLSFNCEAFKQNLIEKYPVKSAKKVPAVRYMYYFVITFVNNTQQYLLMRKRSGNNIWKNLYDFPCIETEAAVEIDFLLELFEREGLSGGNNYKIKHVSDEYIHILSHRRLLAKFIRIEMAGVPILSENLIAVSNNRIAELPIPRLIDRYLATIL